MEFNPQNKNIVCLHFDMDLACNNRCSYCYKLDKLDNTKFLNRPVFDEVIKQIEVLRNKQPDLRINIDLMGGEPLLVVDNVVEFIEKVSSDDTTIRVITNLNFPSGSQQIQKLISLYKYNKNFGITTTMHESSNIEWVKNNIILCADFCIVNLLVDDNNLNRVYNEYLWLRKETDVEYCIEGIIDPDGNNTLTLISDTKFIEMVEHSMDNKDNDVLDGKVYTYIESMENDFLNISKYYYTVCRMSQLVIDYSGEIRSICGYPYDGGNIKDGLVVPDVFCNRYGCRCSTNTYKRLVRERNDN